MDRIKIAYTRWTKLRPLQFILVTTVLSILLTIPIAIGIELMGINDEAIGSFPYEKYGVIGIILIALILAPILETGIGQSLPIYLTQRFVKWKTTILAVIFSTLLFSLGHIQYSFWYFLLTIPTGGFLALTYIVFQNRKESSFWMTCFVHSARNLIAVLFSLGEIIK